MKLVPIKSFICFFLKGYWNEFSNLILLVMAGISLTKADVFKITDITSMRSSLPKYVYHGQTRLRNQPVCTNGCVCEGCHQ
jgi:hypothetical protein